jgi:arylformamidase
MNIELKINGESYTSNLNKGQSIAITLLPNGRQPNHFGAPECVSETLIAEDFIGDTKLSGSCNVNKLTIIPHCNGTHTESVSHIVNQLVPVYQAIEDSFFPCILVSLQAQSASETKEAYRPCLDKDNKVITKEQLELSIKGFSNQQLQGLVIRTVPNDIEKKSRIYDNDHYPPFLTNDAMNYLVKRQVKHLMVDFPSVDKMYDDGQLTNHRIFWNIAFEDKNMNPQSITNKTITEMVFVNDEIEDGSYLCNLQIPEIETDAVPSRPVLYKLI